MRVHGRRVTNTYPPKPRTAGTINNIPNTVFTMMLSIPLSHTSPPAGAWRPSRIFGAMTTVAARSCAHNHPEGDL